MDENLPNISIVPQLTNNNNVSSPAKTIILNIEAGVDIIQTVVQYACTHSTFLAIMTANGLVSEAKLAYPDDHRSCEITRNMQILTLTGTCDGRNAASFSSARKSFVVQLAASGNEIVAGAVVGGLKAASHVTLVAAARSAP